MDKCSKCGRPCEFSHVENGKKGRYEVYFCNEGHETRVKVQDVKTVKVIPGFPRTG